MINNKHCPNRLSFDGHRSTSKFLLKPRQSRFFKKPPIVKLNSQRNNKGIPHNSNIYNISHYFTVVNVSYYWISRLDLSNTLIIVPWYFNLSPTIIVIIFCDFWCFIKFFFNHKWNESRLLVINMVYTRWLNSCRMTDNLGR